MELNETLELLVPPEDAYQHWSDLESFPRYLSGVDRVEQDGDGYSHWMVSLLSFQREFEAKVLSEAGHRVVWQSEPDGHHHGEVRFDPAGDGRCRMTVRVSMTPRGIEERVAVLFGLIRARVHKVMRQFKERVETVAVPENVQPEADTEPAPSEQIANVVDPRQRRKDPPR